MLLAIDIGNTNVVFGVHDGKQWLHHWRVRTVREKMPDEYGVLFRTFLAEAKLNIHDFGQIAISSVVPPLTGKFEEMLADCADKRALIISSRVRTDLTFAVDNPAEVGADLIADAVAAYTRFHEACVVVDFGTATTFSVVSDSAEFLGVAIAPGVNLAASALAGGTAQLPHINLLAPSSPIGTNTTASIQAGVVLGYVGLVEGLLDRIWTVLGKRTPVIATGGLSRLIAPLTDCFVAYDPWLTLEGIYLIALKNF